MRWYMLAVYASGVSAARECFEYFYRLGCVTISCFGAFLQIEIVRVDVCPCILCKILGEVTDHNSGSHELCYIPTEEKDQVKITKFSRKKRGVEW